MNKKRVKIIQILRVEPQELPAYTLDEYFIGLGDDSLIYHWHNGTGKWILHVINK